MLSSILYRIAALLFVTGTVFAGLAVQAGERLPAPPQIAYVSSSSFEEYNIELVDVARRLSVPLLRYPVRVSQPVWSPGGDKLVYRVYFPRAHELVILDLNTGEQTRIDDGSTFASLPAWSPDGAQIAFASNRGGYFFLYLYDVAGGSVRRLTNSTVNDDTPAWTPDGNAILFTAWRATDGISMVTPAGQDERRLVTHINLNRGVSWSPDRARFVFPLLVTATARPYVTLMMAALPDHPGRAAPTLLTEGLSPHYDPDWSPDGRRIAFASTRDGDREIYIMAVDDRATLRRLTFHNAADLRPAWSPDGRRIAFISERDGSDLYALDVSSGGIQRLTFGMGVSTGFAWRPGR